MNEVSIAVDPASVSHTPVAADGADSSMVSMIERVAMAPDVPIERLQALLDMQERVMERQNRAEHARDKAAAMAEMPNVPMNGKGHNKMPYATLKDITTTTRPVLAAHGLSLTFSTEAGDKFITVTARLTHANGYEDTVSLPLPFDTSGNKSAVQSIGSSQTYGQRYTAQAILGLSMGLDTDTDGAPGAGETITADQFRALRDKIDEAGADEAKFLKYLKVEQLEELPLAKFGAADAALDRKIADAAERESTDA